MKLFWLLLILSTTALPAPKKTVEDLKEELYKLEGEIFYKKHFAYSNALRERAAFIVAIGGIVGSGIAPFKLIEGRHSYMQTFIKRMGVCAASLCATLSTAYTISYFRPVLWYKEHQRDLLKKKIIEL